jgi:hypothetical protein
VLVVVAEDCVCGCAVCADLPCVPAVASEEPEGQDPVVGTCRTFLRKVFHQLEESESQDPVGGVGVAPLPLEEEPEEPDGEEEPEEQETGVGVGLVFQSKV